MDDPDIEELFYIDYLQKKNRLGSRKKEAESSEEADSSVENIQ